MFGMGTGGSLRLLSPEILRSLDAFAAAFLVPSVRPSNGLPTAFLRRRFRLWHLRASALRALALPRRAPSKPHRDELPSRPTKARSPLFSSLRFRLPASASSKSVLSDQALDRLVSSSSIRYRTSTDDLSTLSSSRGLTCSWQWQFSSLGGLHA